MKSTRKEKTDKQQITIVLGVVVRNKKVLMTQRFEPQCPDAHLKWELPGGRIDFGEEAQDAVERELLEETGVKVRVQKLLPTVRTCIWSYSDGTKKHTILIGYKCKFISQEIQKKKDHRIEKVEWVKLSDVKKLEVLPGDPDFIKEATRGIRELS